ncbi:hypothetical protein QE412_000276 [Microbacterium trichothecenolyticum]|uniref:Uncharacterized protein n=1 Tax=Microbacterium trichothecenolyticum TaxID=69370 RepID=A0ABU0TPV0_MICTR|nr:hypothetical protein [Microbacterium trichothecenolyticum]
MKTRNPRWGTGGFGEVTLRVRCLPEKQGHEECGPRVFLGGAAGGGDEIFLADVSILTSPGENGGNWT